MKRGTQETISYRRALLIATIPSLGTWKQIGENPSPKDRPFSRRPRVLEAIKLPISLGAAAAGVAAGSTIILILGGLSAMTWAIRPLGRLLIPRRLAHSERELLALTLLTRPAHLIFLALPIYLALKGEWLAAEVMACLVLVGILLGVFLLRLMFSGLVNRKENHAIK